MFETAIICDGCGGAIAYADNVHKCILVMIAREKGWSIGKYHLCPDCKKMRKKLKKDGVLN